MPRVMRLLSLVMLAVGSIVLACTSTLAAGSDANKTASQHPSSVSAKSPLSGDLTMDFEGMDIRSFARFISDLTGKNIIVADDVKGDITLISPKKLTPKEAYEVFQSILEVNGATIVPGKNALKVVMAKQGKTMGLETRPESGQSGDEHRLVTRIIPLTNADVTDVVTILTPMVSPNGLVSGYGPSNTIFLTDYGANIERLLQIIKGLDVEQAKLMVFTLKNAGAKKLAERLSEFWSTQSQKKGGAKRIPGVFADERTNTLVVMADPTQIQQVRELVQQLDQPTLKANGNYRVYNLKNAEAEELAKELGELVNATKTGGTTKKELNAEGVRIIADKGTNTLVVMAPSEEFPLFDEIIAQLDRPRRGVFVEALIMEVSTDKSVTFGVNWVAGGRVNAVGDNKKGGLVYGGFESSSTSVGTQNSLTLPGGLSVGMLTFPVKIGDFVYSNIQALISDGKSNNTFNILSTPQLMTLDNEEASITVAENRPYLTATDSGQNKQDRTYQQFDYKDVGTKLKITPHIGQSDSIRLKILQEVSRVDKAETLDTGSLQPTTRKRATQTTVQVKDGQTIVISGLMGVSDQDSFSNVPGISDIPVLGWLFKHKSKTREKTNLYVFITPRIVQSPAQAAAIHQEKASALSHAIEASQVEEPRTEGVPVRSGAMPASEMSGNEGAHPVLKPLILLDPMFRDDAKVSGNP
ncbi:general secretion pathway protein D [Solidesulfovibrio fructosivorans JJ]]|uniref:General secretion pathway protein D n=1 Tax=Solidesulfovibrio fructosivorans JJ] TaxID=596151 RepID=E1K103_SOLFR|nr:type II secretion system secretin GspD [Solidesulfovibrio fructosivorans]EFL49699.1 general secretion pathway protein D [Solidesulfovibrio fructosivorans JJ]]